RQPESNRGRARRAPRALPARKPGLALLDEGGHPLLLVLAREELREGLGLVGQRRGEVALQRAVREFLRPGEDERALRGEQTRELERLRHQLAGGEDGVHEPALARLLGADHAPGVDELLRQPDAAGPRETLRAAPARDDSDRDLRLPQPRRVGCVADVAGQCELAAAAEREAVDRGDRRLRHRLEQPSGLLSERSPGARLVHPQRLHVLDVGAGDERPLARAGEDDDAGCLVAGELDEPVAKLDERGTVERVQRLRPVDGDDGDGLLAGEGDRHQATFARRNSTMSRVGAPGVNTSATPSLFSSRASSVGIVPPTTTSTSSASLARRSSRMRGTSVMCAPDRMETPTASASSWMTVSTICSGVWWRPV